MGWVRRALRDEGGRVRREAEKRKKLMETDGGRRKEKRERVCPANETLITINCRIVWQIDRIYEWWYFSRGIEKLSWERGRRGRHAPLFRSLFSLSLFLFSEKSRDTGWDPADPSPPSETKTLLSPRPLSVYMPHHALPVGPATASRAWLAVADGGARGISGNPRWGFRMTDSPERMADGVERRGRYSRSGRWFSASAATGCRNHILCLYVLSAFSFFSQTKIAIGSSRVL